MYRDNPSHLLPQALVHHGLVSAALRHCAVERGQVDFGATDHGVDLPLPPGLGEEGRKRGPPLGAGLVVSAVAELMDTLDTSLELESGGIDGIRGLPSLGGTDTADAVWFSSCPDAVDIREGLLELLLCRVEAGGSWDDAAFQAAVDAWGRHLACAGVGEAPLLRPLRGT